MIYAHLSPPDLVPVPTQAETLIAHADVIEHAAALGGWVDAKGVRHGLTEDQRQRWARDAAVIRATAMDAMGGSET